MTPTARNILKKAGFQPLKRFGQNFLIDKNTINKIIEAGKVSPEDIVLEIGPGTGVLTAELAKKAKKIIAVEKDARMCEVLKKTLQHFDNIEVLNEDIRKMPEIRREEYKVIANLPFYLSALVIRKFLESKNQPKEMVLIIQKEVAQRIAAKAPDMNLLAASVQFYAKAEIISYISKKSFWPQPEVDAAIIKITPQKLSPDSDPDKFFLVVKAGFSQPRKQLINNLSKKLKIDKDEIEKLLLKNKISPTRRAETLTLEDWIKLAKKLTSL
ncbi:MAG: 16S rRNA (adenine(1518)-N(6)/adenine(1519)-N(6))-dimethyltransferase RsmA [bacterium]|nr:16S rRNA (adenine(1518)-N(6)/adenine(1519)-N(6))-dimethyltransferase RsmA [bacterium]